MLVNAKIKFFVHSTIIFFFIKNFEKNTPVGPKGKLKV
jgi:hypothetical protein